MKMQFKKLFLILKIMAIVTVVNDSSKRYIKINWGNEDETEKV